MLERLDQLVVKEVNGSGGYGMLVGPHATAAQREQFARQDHGRSRTTTSPSRRWRSRPARPRSTSGVSPRHVDLRPFVLSGADGVRIVPGGLTRVALKEGSLVVNSSQGGGTKDTWIVDDAERRGLTPCSRAPPTICSGSPARWSARNIIARTIEATLRLEYLPQDRSRADRRMGGRAQRRRRLRRASSTKHGELNEEAAIEYLTFDRDNPSSIRNCFENARADGRAVRTALTAETWTAINDAWLELKRFEASRRVNRALDREELMRFLDYVKKASLDFDGSCYRTMLRNDAYWFNRLGVFIERADNTARLLDVKYHCCCPRPNGRRPARLFPVGRDPARGLGGHRLSLGLSRPGEAVADRRPPDPEAGHAAFAHLLLRKHRPRARRTRPRRWAQRRSRSVRRGRCTRSSKRSSMTEIFQGGLHEFITEFIEDNARLSTTISDQYLFN